MEHNARHELMGEHLQFGIHVRLAKRHWVRCYRLLQAAPGGSMGHPTLLPVRCSRPELHFPNNKSIWLLDQHNNHHHQKIREHRGFFAVKWEPTLRETMGERCNGLLWIILPDLPEMEEVAENAEEEEVQLSELMIFSLYM